MELQFTQLYFKTGFGRVVDAIAVTQHERLSCGCRDMEEL